MDHNKILDKKIMFIYVIVIFGIVLGITYALGTTSLAFNVNTAIIGIDEAAYGNTTFDSSALEFVPILDNAVEASTNNVIKIDFKVGGAETNNHEKIIYDIALNDLQVNCALLSPYIKWKLIKNGTQISNGSLDYKFDTIVDGRLVLTTIQQDLQPYNATNKSQYDSYTFYMWFSDSCQNSDISTCTNKLDQTSMLDQYLSGKVEVELYTESKKELVRNPATTLDSSTCQNSYLVTFNFNGGVSDSSSKVAVPIKDNVITLPEVTKYGSTFEGWYSDKDFSTKVGNAEDKYTVTSSQTLYAKWNSISYVVTLNNQNATTAGTGSVLAVYGNAMPAITLPKKEYVVTYDPNGGSVSSTKETATYTFGGYYTGTNGSGTQYYTSTGASANNWNLTQATTLYAKWTQKAITLATPTRTSWTFDGWYTAASGGTKVGVAGASYTPSANITLYAHWTANVTAVALASGPSKTTYSASESFNSSGIKLKLTYADGTTQTIDGTSYITGTVTNNDNSNGVRYTTTIKYGSFNAITVTTYKAGWYGYASTGNAYYYTGNGNKVTGSQYLTNASGSGASYYYFNSSGVMLTGWVEPGDGYKYYYARYAVEGGDYASTSVNGISVPRGARVINSYVRVLQSSRGVWHTYYLNAYGRAATGWTALDGVCRFFQTDTSSGCSNWSGPQGSMVSMSHGYESYESGTGNYVIGGTTYKVDGNGIVTGGRC